MSDATREQGWLNDTPEHRAANQASFAQNGLDWCAHSMAYDWPRNAYGSLLTNDEYAGLLAELRRVRDGVSGATEPPLPPRAAVGEGQVVVPIEALDDTAMAATIRAGLRAALRAADGGTP